MKLSRVILGLLILFLFTLPLVLFSAQQKQQTNTKAAPAQTSETFVTNPTFGVIAPCPSCSNPTNAPVISSSVGPTGQVVNPTNGSISTPAPSTVPCETTEVSIAANHNSSRHHQKKHHGALSGGMDALLKFLIEFLNMLLKLLGGGQIPVPSPSPDLQPSDSPQPSIVPCQPSGVPTQVPQPTMPQPTTGASLTSSPTAPTQTTNCLPSPHLCGFPDETNTGYVPTGVALTPYTGPLNITTPGTVIDGKLINGMIEINAANVTIKRSKVVFPHQTCSGSCWAVSMFGSNGLIQDVEVDGNGGACFVGVLVGAGGNVAQRVNSHNCGDGFRADDGAVIKDSYLHDQWKGAVDGVCVDETHNDGIQSTGHSHQVFDHNTFILWHYTDGCPGAGVNNVITISNEDGAPTDDVVSNNLLDGGGFTIRTAANATNIRVSNNRIGRHIEYGTPFVFDGDVTATGNIWDDTSAVVN